MHAALAGGDKKFSADRRLFKLPMLLSNNSINQFQLMLSLMDAACELGNFRLFLRSGCF